MQGIANRGVLGIGDALRSVAQVAQRTTAEVAKHLTEDGGALLGHLRDAAGPLGTFRCSATYRLGQQTGTCGLWKIFSATAKSVTALHKEVSIWILDKKVLSESQKG
jgi:hypothetical protein